MLTDKQLDWLATRNAKLEISVESFEEEHAADVCLRIDAADGCGLERKTAEERIPLPEVVAAGATRRALLNDRVDRLMERLTEAC